MTIITKRHMPAHPHLYPAPRPRSKITDVATAQKNHVNRAKPATIPKAPWEAETPQPETQHND